MLKQVAGCHVSAPGLILSSGYYVDLKQVLVTTEKITRYLKNILCEYTERVNKSK